ncbi:MAG: YfhO family protein [Planctomycetota bacterium]|nr:YfhO family protein [Planctomycetota bacterium]
MSRRLTHLALVLYFALLTFALFGDLLTTSRAVVSGVDMDVDQQYFAWRSFAFGELRAGRLPLWNPYPFGGVPALGNFQNAVLYPPNWLHLVLPTGRAINWIFALHVFLAGVLAAAWCRARRSGVIASALGGTIYALGGSFILHVYAGHLNYLTTLSWTPLLFIGVHRVLAGGRRATSGWMLGTLAVAMQVLTGCPQPAYYAGLAVLVYALVRLIRSPLRAWLRAGGAIAAMFLFGALLSAAQLLPAIEAGRESVRAEPLDFETAASYSLPPANLLTLISPYPFGDDFVTPYAGRWLMWEVSLYVGPVAFVLAMIGIRSSKRQGNGAVGGLAVVAIVLALGSYHPLFRVLYEVLPGWDRFRAPVRFNVILSLMIAALAARGFDELLRRRFVATRAAAGTLILAALVATFALVIRARPEAWAVFLEDTSHLARSASHGSGQLLRTALVLAQVGVVLLLLRRARWIAYALVVILVADLFLAAGRAIERFQPQAEAPAAWRDALASRKPDERVVTIATSQANLAAHLGAEDAWGYDPAMPSRWGSLVGTLLRADPRAGDFVVKTVQPSPVWSMLRVRHALPPTQTFSDEPMPRVALIDDAVVVDGPQGSLAAVLDPSFDPRLRVVLESPPNPAPRPGATGIVEVTRREPARLEITAETRLPTILLITDAYSAGWRVRSLMGASRVTYDLLPANHALRAIPLGVGRHNLVLEYAPPSVTIGLWISAVAWSMFTIACIAVGFIAKNAKDAKHAKKN